MWKCRCIRVGVTGHRFLQKIPDLMCATHTALEEIAARHPNMPMALYSPLAPGADQLAALAALERDLYLVAVIPFAYDHYREGFSGEDGALFARLASMAEQTEQLYGDPESESRFQALGDYLVKRMDYLIAIWNGMPAEGPGGTGEVVDCFRRTGKPLIWIRADNSTPDAPVYLPDPLQQGSIVYENW